MRILVSPAYGGDVSELDYGISDDLDREVEDVFDLLDDARHLQHHAARGGFQRARGHQPVVTLDRAEHVREGDVVGFEHHGVDDDLQ